MEAGTKNESLERLLAEQIITNDFDALLVVLAKDDKVDVAYIGNPIIALGLAEFAKTGICQEMGDDDECD